MARGNALNGHNRKATLAAMNFPPPITGACSDFSFCSPTNDPLHNANSNAKFAAILLMPTPVSAVYRLEEILNGKIPARQSRPAKGQSEPAAQRRSRRVRRGLLNAWQRRNHSPACQKARRMAEARNPTTRKNCWSKTYPPCSSSTTPNSTHSLTPFAPSTPKARS